METGINHVWHRLNEALPVSDSFSFQREEDDAEALRTISPAQPTSVNPARGGGINQRRF